MTLDYVNGYPIGKMNLPPLETLTLNSSISERHIYQNFCSMQKMCLGAYQELFPIVRWMEENLCEGFLKYETGSYYNIIFYYSYINFNAEKAALYYSRAYDELIHDTDSNGRRVLAYYQFYVLKKPEEAHATAILGLNNISNFSICDAERAYEKNLLNTLIQNIASILQ